MNPLAIIFDCGATNVRVVAINAQGEIEALQSYPNQTEKDPYFPEGRIWEVEAIWNKLSRACKAVIAQIDPTRIVGITTTTFGVDGTFVDAQNNLLYPVISWQCPRTIWRIQPIKVTFRGTSKKQGKLKTSLAYVKNFSHNCSR